MSKIFIGIVALKGGTKWKMVHIHCHNTQELTVFVIFIIHGYVSCKPASLKFCTTGFSIML
jgi:hypothetical protein